MPQSHAVIIIIYFYTNMQSENEVNIAGFDSRFYAKIFFFQFQVKMKFQLSTCLIFFLMGFEL